MGRTSTRYEVYLLIPSECCTGSDTYNMDWLMVMVVVVPSDSSSSNNNNNVRFHETPIHDPSTHDSTHRNVHCCILRSHASLNSRLMHHGTAIGHSQTTKYNSNLVLIVVCVKSKPESVVDVGCTTHEWNHESINVNGLKEWTKGITTELLVLE